MSDVCAFQSNMCKTKDAIDFFAPNVMRLVWLI